MSEVKFLRQAAIEIRAENHAGWGNTCDQAADHIEALQAKLDAAESVRDDYWDALQTAVGQNKALQEEIRAKLEAAENERDGIQNQLDICRSNTGADKDYQAELRAKLEAAEVDINKLNRIDRDICTALNLRGNGKEQVLVGIKALTDTNEKLRGYARHRNAPLDSSLNRCPAGVLVYVHGARRKPNGECNCGLDELLQEKDDA